MRPLLHILPGRTLASVVFGLLALLPWSPAVGGTLVFFSNADGLSAEAEFTLINASMLEVRLKNTSTGVPADFGPGADQILTSISWDFDGTTQIAGGSVSTGPSSASLDFSITDVGASADVSGEYGFGNGGATGLFDNYISGNVSGTTKFGVVNLDGPASLNGPQAGLVADPLPIGLGGQGAIQDEWIATLTLSGDPLTSLDFLDNLVTIEFGSDAAFITAPEPSSLGLLLAAGVAWLAFLGVRARRPAARGPIPASIMNIPFGAATADGFFLNNRLPAGLVCAVSVHELFHMVQFQYRTRGTGTGWRQSVIEGGATFAEDTVADRLNRSPRLTKTTNCATSIVPIEPCRSGSPAVAAR